MLATVGLTLGLALATAAGGAAATPSALGLPADLSLDAPIARSDGGIPLGNGWTGGLLWGGGRRIEVSLNRGDLWDLRRPAIDRAPDWTYATIRRLVRAGDQREVSRRFDDPYILPTPTKLPPVRLSILLPADHAVRRFALTFAAAEARVDIAGSAAPLRAFFSAVEPVAFVRVPLRDVRCELRASPALARLGYARATMRRGSLGAGQSYLALDQRGADGLRYVVIAAARSDATGSTVAIAIRASHDGSDPLAVGLRRMRGALATSYDAPRSEHRRWWRRFWQTSTVVIPDPALQRDYDFAKYVYGAASRRDAPPISLQGIWTVDDGTLPPWKSDFHNDLNTQMSYLPYLEGGFFNAGASFIDFNWNLLPTYRRFARTFFAIPGAVVPGVETLDGSAVGGWSQYALSPTMGAWVAQTFYLQWRYERDRTFLHDRAYPFCAAIGTSLAALLVPAANGKLRLPLSSSPEIFDNTLRAWLTPDSNFDQALLRWLFGALAELASADGDPAAATHWQALLERLEPLDVVRGPSGARVLSIGPGVAVQSSHRHFSHLLAFYPLGSLSVHRSQAERDLVDASLADTLRFGTADWAGWSFPLMSAMLARAGRAAEALDELTAFDRAALGPNLFHQNGDVKRSGAMRSTDGVFTLEGNLEVMQAVNEMLLQSADGVVRLFPATSPRWPDAHFERLRAEGGFIVSAARRGGRTVTSRILATKPVRLVLADPFDGGVPRWSRRDVRREADGYAVDMQPGDVLAGAR